MTLKKMTLDEKVGQVMMVFYFGGFTSAESDEYREMLALVEQKHIGGLVVRTRGTPLGVGRSQVYPTAALANQLQAHARIPLLVAADFERGTSMRLEEGTSFPFAMAVGATGDPRDAYTMGKVTALEARAVGVHWVFAPVADVNNNPDNPIINTRSFGEDPRRVSEFVAAFVRGVEDHGALSCVKHFPGHGDTSVDSHLDLPTVQGDRARFDAVELPPFRAAIAAAASTVMTAHLAVPAFEPDPDLPATLSPRLTTGLLRKELGFEGIIVTDAMDMGGVTVRYAPGDAAARSFQAGSDMLLVPPVLDAAIAALKDGVTSGRIPMAQLDDSVRRILRTKARLGLHKQKLVDLNALNTAFGRKEFLDAALDISDRGITLLRNDENLVPLDATQPRRMLLVAVSGDADPAPAVDLERELRWRVDSLQTVRVDTRYFRVEEARIPPPENYDVAVVALFVRVADRKNTVGLPPDHAALVQQILSAGKPVVVMGFGSPYLVAGFPQARTWLAAFSTFDVSQRSAARALFGQTAIAGQLPVSVPGTFTIGAGGRTPAHPMKLSAAPAEWEARLAPAYQAMESALADRAFPGGVLAVAHRGQLALRAFGKMSYDAGAPAVAPDTIYDLASLTKPLVTATSAALLVSSGRLQWDQPVARYVPEFAAGPQPEWRGKITMRHLLMHTSGLPSYKPLYKEATNKTEMLAKICAEPIEAEPGARARYSDLGFALAGIVVERLTGKTLDVLTRDTLWTRLGMKDTEYNPPAALLPRIAPTENDTTYRNRLLRGVVHDENAFAMGGLSGHAGLFATAADVAIFGEMLRQGGIYAHQRILPRRSVDLLTRKQKVGDLERALGWQSPGAHGFAGKYASAIGFGHTGFTGTSVWIDPEKELVVVLLTNRVHPTRANETIEQVRPLVHNAVYESLGLVPQS
jgi:beta-glucosidase-like glycosyl hydrolase/CubicO group peptidase (beta-lactamase class C family)